MRTHIALLRGINVGGRNMVKMADLRKMFEDLGLTQSETLLQSGNVVFGGSSSSDSDLQALLQSEASKRLGIDVKFFVRSTAELDEVITGNPFPNEAESDPGHLLVHFMGSTPLAYDVDKVQAAILGPEQVRAGARHLYVVYPDGVGTSTVGRTSGWNRLVADGTARNWNTVLKLAALLRQS